MAPKFHFEPDAASTQPGLRRLTVRELERTVLDVTGVVPDVSNLPADLEHINLQNDAGRLSIRDGNHLQALLRMASQVAADADIAAVLPCAAECTDGELRTYLERRAFGMPLDAESFGRYRDIYDRALAAMTPRLARRAVVQASLFSPYLLYRTEIGDDSGQLTPFELAEKLSYFIWGRPPDGPLSLAAFDGTLSDPAVFASHIDRLIQHEYTHERVVELIFDWLGLDHFDLQSKDAASELPTGLEASMVEEVERMIRAVIFEGEGTLRALMTTETTYVDGVLAEHYGIDGITSADFQEVSLAGTGRAGLLTTALVLSAHAKESGRSPMQRGKFLLDELLCMGFPPEAGIAAMSLPAGVDDLTFREQFAPLETTAPCSNCHRMLNAGFAYDVFDTVGRRFPVDRVSANEASGIFELRPYETLRFDSTGEATIGFSEHPALVRCFVAQSHRFAQGSVPSLEDADRMGQLETHFDSNDGDVVELLRQIALSERFRQAVQ